MNYDDSVDMINGVIRDIAYWDLVRRGEHPDEGADLDQLQLGRCLH